MFTVRLAGIPIGIDNKYSFVELQCRKYLTNEEPAFTVSVSDEELARENSEAGEEIMRTRRDPAGYLESVCVYRKICKTLPYYDAFLIHGAAVACDGKAYMFSAPSGTGKSTHLRLWMKTHGDELTIINGDKPIVRKAGGEFLVFGTPWSGKECWENNISAPLDALCFLSRGTENSIAPLSSSLAAEAIFRQIIYPSDPALLTKMLSLVNELLLSTRCYRLYCNISTEAAELSFRTMTGKERA